MKGLYEDETHLFRDRRPDFLESVFKVLTGDLDVSHRTAGECVI
jgi:hypothetical protein